MLAGHIASLVRLQRAPTRLQTQNPGPKEKPPRLAEKQPPKEILAEQLGELRLRRMKVAVKSPKLAVYRCGLGIFLTETPPPFPRNPLFPALRSDPMALSGTYIRKQIPSSPPPAINHRKKHVAPLRSLHPASDRSEYALSDANGDYRRQEKMQSFWQTTPRIIYPNSDRNTFESKT